jgi:hypothetical protein
LALIAGVDVAVMVVCLASGSTLNGALTSLAAFNLVQGLGPLFRVETKVEKAGRSPPKLFLVVLEVTLEVTTQLQQQTTTSVIFSYPLHSTTPCRSNEHHSTIII